MTDEIFKIVYLPSMRVASFHAMGKNIGEPELKAWEKLKDWAKTKGLLDNPTKHQIFGFNNPAPFHINEGKPYGYELWITIGKDFKVEEEFRTKTIEGGMYAVITCKMELHGKNFFNGFKKVKNMTIIQTGNPSMNIMMKIILIMAYLDWNIYQMHP